ncbi:MAG: hypothetical protein R3F07_07515 [Opitutaceae bacterium]
MSKTDALGDQILATGLVRHLLEADPDIRIVWMVRTGNESLASLLRGAAVAVVDPERPPADQAKRALKALVNPGELWGRVLFVAVPINPYKAHQEDLPPVLRWWSRFTRRLRPETAVVGSTTRNWLDQFLVGSSRASRRIGFGASNGSQELADDVYALIPGQPVALSDEIPFADELDEAGRLGRLAEAASGVKGPIRPTIAPPEVNLRHSRKDLSRSLVVAPGVGDPRRRTNSAALARGIAQFLKSTDEFDPKCLLVEGPLDRAIVSELSRYLRKEGISPTRFRFDADGLPRLASLLGRTSLFLTHETFYAQLAALLKTPSVALWGLGHWRRFFPPLGDMTVVHTSMPCSGCEWHCVFDRWKCITDLRPEAIAQGLAAQRAGRRSPGIHFLDTPAPVPAEEVRSALKETGQAAARLRDENNRQREWLCQLRQRTKDLEGWARAEARGREKLQALNEEIDARLTSHRGWAEEEARLRSEAQTLLKSAEKQRDEIRGWAEEEKRLREEASRLLADAERQRDDLAAAIREEQRLRAEAARLVRETEEQREAARSWAEAEQLRRKAAEALLRETEVQRDSHMKWAREEQRLREAAESLLAETESQLDAHLRWAAEEKTRREAAENLLRETEAQRDSHLKWALEEQRIREKTLSLLSETEKQRDAHLQWAGDEKSRREAAEALLRETEAQRDSQLKWAREEERLRKTAEALRKETEKQRDDAFAWAREEELQRKTLGKALTDAEEQRTKATAWAEEERALRVEADRLREDAERQRDAAVAWAQEERALRVEATRLREDAERHRDAAVAWAEKERALRVEATRLREDAERQRDAAVAWAQEEQAVRGNLEKVLGDAEKQRDDRTAWAEEEKAWRLRLQEELKQCQTRIQHLEISLRTKEQHVREEKSSRDELARRLAMVSGQLEAMTARFNRYDQIAACRAILGILDRFRSDPEKNETTK